MATFEHDTFPGTPEGVLQNKCPPTLNALEDIVKHYTEHSQTKESKDYASNIIKLDFEQLQHHIHLFEKPIKDITPTEAKHLLSIIRNVDRLLKFDDECDGKGTSYLTTIVDNFCPNSVNFFHTQKDFQDRIVTAIDPKGNLSARVRQVSKCNFK